MDFVFVFMCFVQGMCLLKKRASYFNLHGAGWRWNWRSKPES
jgi:hypothetical protein